MPFATRDGGALKLLRRTSRVRGQVIWMAQPANHEAGRPARAVAVEFDAEDMFVREAEDGILIVSNLNHCFRREFEGHEHAASRDGVYATLLDRIESHSPAASRIITLTGRPNTLHSVEVDFGRRCMYVAHGQLPAHESEFVAYELP